MTENMFTRRGFKVTHLNESNFIAYKENLCVVVNAEDENRIVAMATKHAVQSILEFYVSNQCNGDIARMCIRHADKLGVTMNICGYYTYNQLNGKLLFN